MPALFVWPAFHWSADTMVTTGLLVYTGVAWGLLAIAARVPAREATHA
jgi:hypothetical protein